MAMAILPAISVGGRAVASAMPSLVSAAKKYAPAAYQQLAQFTGSKTPDALASEIAKTGNGMQAQGLMFNAVKSGVTLEMIAGAIPLMTGADMEMLAGHHMEQVKKERALVDSTRLVVGGSQIVSPPAEDVLRIENTCNMLGITSTQLADLIVAIEMTKPSTIAQYQAYFRSIKKVPR